MFAVVWKLSANETYQVLIDPPENCSGNITSENAIVEGRSLLLDAEGLDLKPIGVVELNADLMDKIGEFEYVEIEAPQKSNGDEGEWIVFRDMTNTDLFSDQPWWPSK